MGVWFFLDPVGDPVGDPVSEGLISITAPTNIPFVCVNQAFEAADDARRIPLLLRTDSAGPSSRPYPR